MPVRAVTNVVLLMIAAAPLLAAIAIEPALENTPGPSSENDQPLRSIREGDGYTAIGRIAQTGDRYTFYSRDQKNAVRMLENLNLERVARILDDAGRTNYTPLWQVQGTMYEFRGGYYLLLTRAVIKGRAEGGASQ